MIKKTNSNFSIVVSILQNQAYYNYYVACDKANEISIVYKPKENPA